MKMLLEIADSLDATKARAVFQLGEQVAAGPKRDYRLALDYHLQALEQAEARARGLMSAPARSRPQASGADFVTTLPARDL